VTLNADAVIIGVDEYDRQGIMKLPGCVNDAVNAAKWLINIGMPPNRIIAHIAPFDPKLLPAGVTALTADDKSIRASFNKLSKGGSGDKLFLFMSGHGRYVTDGGGPVFLCQDYYVNDSTRENLAIEEYIDWFRSWRYRDQFLFYDACQDDTASLGQISPVYASGPDAQPGTYAQDPNVSFTVCYSCSPGQRAWAGDGRGVLVRFALEELAPALWANLHPDDPEQDAIQYDWLTGSRVVDLDRLFTNIIAGKIVQAAGTAKRYQTPLCQSFGRALVDGFSPIMELPPLTTTTVNVDVDPPAAVGDVQSIRVGSQIIPRACFMPLKGGPLKIPVALKFPLTDRITAGCRLTPQSTWQAVNIPLQANLDQPSIDLTIELRQPPGTNPRAGNGTDEINIVVNGGVDSLPPEIVRQLNTAGAQANFPTGMSIREDDSGPTIGLDSHDVGTIRHANQVAAIWLKSIRRYNRGTGTSVVLSPLGEPKDLRPKVHFDFGDSTAATIGGYLEDDDCVTLESFSEEIPARTMSLKDLEENPVEWLERGQYRLSIDLPWGRWTTRFRMESEAAVVTLPETIGLEPLRNRYRRHEVLGPSLIMPQHAAEGLAVIPFAIYGYGKSTLWGVPETGVPVTVLKTEGNVRAEPFSETSLREWDDLLTVGRLDIKDATGLVQRLDGNLPGGTANDFGLFALAAAYVEYGRRNLEGVRIILGVMDRHKFYFDDQDLLRLALDLADERLAGDQRQQAIRMQLVDRPLKLPVLRWGVTLLADMARHADLPLPKWRTAIDGSSVLTLVNQSGMSEVVFGSPIQAVDEPGHATGANVPLPLAAEHGWLYQADPGLTARPTSLLEVFRDLERPSEAEFPGLEAPNDRSGSESEEEIEQNQKDADPA
jgi:caspase domain-containing protein